MASKFPIFKHKFFQIQYNNESKLDGFQFYLGVRIRHRTYQKDLNPWEQKRKIQFRFHIQVQNGILVLGELVENVRRKTEKQKKKKNKSELIGIKVKWKCNSYSLRLNSWVAEWAALLFRMLDCLYALGGTQIHLRSGKEWKENLLFGRLGPCSSVVELFSFTPPSPISPIYFMSLIKCPTYIINRIDKLTIARSVLSSLHVYFMSLLKCPNYIFKEDFNENVCF